MTQPHTNRIPAPEGDHLPISTTEGGPLDIVPPPSPHDEILFDDTSDNEKTASQEHCHHFSEKTQSK